MPVERRLLLRLGGGAVLAAVAGAVVALFATGAIGPNPLIADRVDLLYSDLQTDSLPVSAVAATEDGWNEFGQCVMGKGRFFSTPEEGDHKPLMLIFNMDDRLVGINLASPTEQPSPPWEFEDIPITGLKGRELERWALGIYFVPPLQACGARSPGAAYGFD